VDWIYEAWAELAGDRSSGMGPAATPWSVVDQYARRYGIVGDEFEIFTYCVRTLDGALMDYQDKKQDKKDKVQKQKAKRKK
jgi:hypothetical protein